MNIYPENNKGIAWTDATWNPVTGCTKVSTECKHCYAERDFKRPYPGRKFSDVQCHPERLMQPLKVNRPLQVFVNSMSDLFHEAVPFTFIAAVFGIMASTPKHTYQVLTKRPERMLMFFRWIVEVDTTVTPWTNCHWEALKLDDTEYLHKNGDQADGCPWPLPNVWLGVSAGTQAAFDERVPLLVETQAALRFISIEPMLEAIDCQSLEDIDWVIIGGESGNRSTARDCAIEGIEDIVRQCRAKNVPVFVKQLGTNCVSIKCVFEANEWLRQGSYGLCIDTHDRKGDNPAYWRASVRVQEFPR